MGVKIVKWLSTWSLSFRIITGVGGIKTIIRRLKWHKKMERGQLMPVMKMRSTGFS